MQFTNSESFRFRIDLKNSSNQITESKVTSQIQERWGIKNEQQKNTQIYHFIRIIANNKYVIYEPFDSYIIWIGFSVAFEMYFRTIQNWWIFQLCCRWRIKIACSGSHTAVNRELYFGRILNLKNEMKEKKSARLRERKKKHNMNFETNFCWTVHVFQEDTESEAGMPT